MSAAVVIGAGPTLGLSLVRAAARAGLATGFVARRAEAVSGYAETLAGEGLACTGAVGDAADPASLAAAMDRLQATNGAPEVLIYNAAIVEPSRFVTPSGIEKAEYSSAPGWKARGAPMDAAALTESFRTNVEGALSAARHVAPGMIERGRGTILLTGGVLAFGPWIEWGAVSLGKAALRSLGHSLALELGPLGVQVSTVAIHGTMAAGTPYDPDRVADYYMALHRRPAAEWTPDAHFKADEADGKDPDR
ncbi:SDR family NAD(P)-dependent oxidoreductase [Oceanibium sediminis]|uniref:SDR family NAD(P)-dependent oxidoreductase n=1 Tax=Oceanibium sediminis TaxID=2026339 RepID=UPI000DD399D1|nr:SDR family NAD(P)-dependent oxidoreductase [Oceanibium sediminis]